MDHFESLKPEREETNAVVFSMEDRSLQRAHRIHSKQASDCQSHCFFLSVAACRWALANSAGPAQRARGSGALESPEGGGLHSRIPLVCKLDSSPFVLVAGRRCRVAHRC